MIVAVAFSPERLYLQLAMAVLLVRVGAGQSQLVLMSKLTNVFVSSSFSVANLSGCLGVCSGLVSAVSYSEVLRQCMQSFCGNLQLKPDPAWDTYICSQPRSECDLPSPMLQWAMTDRCGYTNTGWLYPGLHMLAQDDTWQYLPSSYLSLQMGLPLFSPAASDARLNSSFSLALNRKSLTMFAWLKSFKPVVSFSILEFGYGSGTNYTGGAQLWLLNGAFFYNFSSADCSGECSGAIYSHSLSAMGNVWMAIALVYDQSTRQFLFYFNGTLANQTGQGSVSFNSQSAWWNAVVINGINYVKQISKRAVTCVKVYSAALSQKRVQAVANSCIQGVVSCKVPIFDDRIFAA